MDFSSRKLPLQVAETMRLCPVDSVHSFAPMLAPVYVFLRLNAKFVSVKSPLDFFTPDELERYRPMESFFMPPQIGAALPFVEAGRKIQTLLNWVPKPIKNLEALPPSPYELSDAILQYIGPLWGPQLYVEPFFMSALATELLPLIPEKDLLEARDTRIELYEMAMLRAGCAVFFALMNGIHHLQYLERIRNEIFCQTAQLNRVAHSRFLPQDLETMELASLLVPDAQGKAIQISDLQALRSKKAAMKILGRLERVTGEPLISQDQPSVSIFGPEGFAFHG